MSERTERDLDRSTYLSAAAGLVAAAAITRLFRLTAWGLAGDELATLRDSLDPALSPVKQLGFWLNHLLVAPFMPLDELGLRLLPVVFGIVGVGVLIAVGSRLLNRRAGLLAGLLLVFNPWHLVWSQTARYYTLVFLLAAVSGTALYFGTIARSRRWLAIGIGATVLAALAHPTGTLPAIGCLGWLGVHVLRRTTGRRRFLLLGGVGAVCVLGLVLAMPLLSQWTGLDQEWGIGGVAVGVSYAVRLGVGTALAAAAGVLLLWIDGRRELALFLAAAVLLPVGLIAVLGLRVAVHTGFLFATAPFAILAAGAFVERVMEGLQGAGRRRLIVAALAGLVVAPGLPSFVSHYLDGSRANYRDASRHVAEQAGPNDLVLTDHTGALLFYEPGLETRPLTRDPARLQAVLDSVRSSSPDARLWLAPLVRSQGGFGMQGFDAIEAWVRPHCELSAEFGAIRIDHQRNFVPVWSCPGTEER